ncbi:MAG: hypothetical protein ACLQBD_10500 [Syntrophobacteraceae bacterium]
MRKRTYSLEGIKAILESKRIQRDCLIRQQEMIGLILKHGEELRSVTMLWLAGEDNFNRWVSEPASAEASIERSKELLAKVEQEIASLEAQL